MLAGWTSGGFFDPFSSSMEPPGLYSYDVLHAVPSYHPMRALRKVLLTGRPKAVNEAKLAGPADEDKAAEVTQSRNPGTIHRAIPRQLTFDFVGFEKFH